MRENRSEVVRFREQQALREQAAQQGLSGLAVVANHEAINARMERGAKRILRLLRSGKQDEALALMSEETWCDEENASEEKESSHA